MPNTPPAEQATPRDVHHSAVVSRLHDLAQRPSSFRAADLRGLAGDTAAWLETLMADLRGHEAELAALPAQAAPDAEAKPELRERLHDLLARDLGDSYDCTRVWSAWGVGTMGEDDFEPVTNRIDDIVTEVIALTSGAAGGEWRRIADVDLPEDHHVDFGEAPYEPGPVLIRDNYGEGKAVALGWLEVIGSHSLRGRSEIKVSDISALA